MIVLKSLNPIQWNKNPRIEKIYYFLHKAGLLSKLNSIEESVINADIERFQKSMKQLEDLNTQLSDSSTWKEELDLHDRTYGALLSFKKKFTLEWRYKVRINIILSLAGGRQNISEIATSLNIQRNTVKKWRDRWIYYKPFLKYFENSDIKSSQFKKIILLILSDDPRSGKNPRISSEQIVDITILACKNPKESNLPITHWTASDLARESVKRGIVDSISPRTISRILKSLDLKPHRIQYWLNSPEKDTPEYKERVNLICSLYEMSQALFDAGVNIISTDEKCGIQTVERLAKTLPLKPKLEERIEHNYKRHETSSLIASLNVANGKLIKPHIGPTRTEKDFLDHIIDVIGNEQDRRWIFILDQLNTHQSESLVRFIAEKCNINIDLGEKGKSGILKSKKTRSKFLEDPTHRIRFLYTPKHTSWLNQIEIWFSILSRKLLKRLNVKSVFELREKVMDFTEYYNLIMGKPFQWSYTGLPCTI